MTRAAEILGAVAFYREHEATFEEALDELVKVAEQWGDEPGDLITGDGGLYAALETALNTNHHRAVMVAAAAVMRLGKTARAARSGSAS